MRLTIQKRLAAQTFGCSQKKILFDNTRLDEIKEAITKSDIRSLIKDNAITKKKTKESSRARARIRSEQRKKGRQCGAGSRKGKKGARLAKKKKWIMKVRAQRKLLETLRGKGIISGKSYRGLYMKAKGGFFRSRRHIKLYIEENNMVLRK